MRTGRLGAPMLTWLHLSDFHVRAGESYDRDVVLRALVSSVRKLRDDGRRPDLIFATGDIGFSGKRGDYETATVLFDALLDAAGLERRRLLVIPGNHDVDRDASIGLARSLSSQEESDAYFAPDAPKPHLAQTQGAFRAWYQEFFAGVRACPDSSCGPVELIQVGTRRIGILPINSALFCRGDDDHAKLWIGRRALDGALAELNEIDPDLRIALIHHPLDWLADAERANIRAMLAGSIDLVLRGHLHETDVERVVSWHGATVGVAAGAAYQTRRWANRALYATVDGPSLAIFPIRYEDSPVEVWTVDPSVFPQADDYTGLFKLRDPPGGDDRVTAVPPPGPPAVARFRSNVPSRRGLPVVGRDAELEEMAASLSDVLGEQLLVLTGAPGVGKSELAREFARQYRDRYPGGTFFVDATSAEVLVDLVRVGTAFLGIEFSEDLKLEDRCQQTLIALGAMPTLLIYDNVQHFEAIERWLPPAGMPCHVVITTVREPPVLGWPMLRIDPLSPEQSVELVGALAGRGAAEVYGMALASQAGGLPVQLCPVASILAYEERRGRGVELRLSSLADETRASFSLVYQLLETSVRLLLHAAAGLNPQRIDRAELTAHLETGASWSETEVNAALDACIDVHLLEGDGELRMHQLVASYLDSLDPADDLTVALTAIGKTRHRRLLATARELCERPTDVALATALLGFRLAPGDWMRVDMPLDAKECYQLALALIEIGEFEQARPWAEQATEDIHGRIDHESLGKSLHLIGFCYSSIGEFEQARPWYEQATEEARKGDGTRGPDPMGQYSGS